MSATFIYPVSGIPTYRFNMTTEPVKITVYPNRKISIFLQGAVDSKRKYAEFELTEEDTENYWYIDYSTYYACYVLTIGDKNYGFN